MYKQKKNAFQKHLDFMFVDIIAFQIAFQIAYALRHNYNVVYYNKIYRELALVMTLVVVVSAFLGNNYKDILYRGYLEELKKVLCQTAIIIMIDFTYLFVTKTSKEYSRIVLGLTWGISVLLIYILRLMWKNHLKKQLQDVRNLSSMIVVATEDMIYDVVEKLSKGIYKRYFISGIVLIESEKRDLNGLDIPVIGNEDSAMEYIQNNTVDTVLIALPRDSVAGKKISKDCSEMGITVHYVIEERTENYSSVIESIGEYVVTTTCIRIAEPRDLFIKRAMDIVGGMVGCILTVIIGIIIGPIIYIQSPGPILFSQKRVGLNGRIFKIYKFRSMYPDAEKRKKELMDQNKIKGYMFKMDDDPRIIPIGKFIRKTSLDEFPQFWNVLKGEMSLVGTRPPTLDEYEQYEKHHKARLATKPGLTGIWQTSGRSNILDFEEVVALDTKYIREWSISLDCKLIFATVKKIFTGEGSV